jgi:hypothetical protein
LDVSSNQLSSLPVGWANSTSSRQGKFFNLSATPQYTDTLPVEPGIQHIAQALAKNSRLTALNIADNAVRLEDAAAFAAALEINTSLSTICFGDAGRSDGELLFASLSADTEHADLSGKGFGCVGAAIIAAFLPRCTALLSLDVSRNQIGW